MQGPPEELYTKVVGVMMGPTVGGEPTRQIAVREMKKKGIRGLELIREPDNPFDKYAIAVYGDYGYGRVQIGYISNKDKFCPGSFKKCEGEYDLRGLCKTCKAMPDRDGLATKLSGYIDQGIRYRAEVAQYTGGSNDKNHGMNIRITRVT